MLTDVCLKIFVRRLDPKDPGADCGRAVSPRSRAIADTFDVATCAAFVPVSVARSSVATSSARNELIDIAEWSACFVSASLAIQGYISISGHMNATTTMSTGNLLKLAGGMYVVLVAREKLPNTAPLYLRNATLACGFVVLGTFLGALLGAASDMNWLYDAEGSYGNWQLIPAAALQFTMMALYYKLAEKGIEVAVIASPQAVRPRVADMLTLATFV